MNEPRQITAGDTASWREELPAYPASAGWALSYALVKADAQIKVDAAADGDAHLVSVAATATAAWKPGSYSWQAYVTKGAERRTLDRGTLEVLPDFAAKKFDGRSHAKKVLAALEALIEGKATKDQMQITLGSKNISRMAIPDLLKWRDRYRAEVAREEKTERIRKGMGAGGNVVVRFR